VSGFVHRAFLYRDEDEWLAGLVPFVREAIIADEPTLVAVSSARVELLRSHVQDDDSIVEWASMEHVGKNPGRIISAWHDFVERHQPARHVRGIGEPVWPGRRPDEVVECMHHEQLLNVAFAGRDFELVCPYDISALPAEVVDGATRSHPYAGSCTSRAPNPSFALSVINDGDLSDPPGDARSVRFGLESLRQVRQLVEVAATRLQLGRARLDDLVLAVSEAATNSVQYGNGGVFSLWSDSERLVCEIRDGGRMSDPLVGRRRPAPDAPRGRGVWMVHQMCDLVQIRSATNGTTVRLAMDLPAT
jgi:anti-sigma regulatory factor (Ser/Thr protein kinase)